MRHTKLLCVFTILVVYTLFVAFTIVAFDNQNYKMYSIICTTIIGFCCAYMAGRRDECYYHEVTKKQK